MKQCSTGLIFFSYYCLLIFFFLWFLILSIYILIYWFFLVTEYILNYKCYSFSSLVNLSIRQVSVRHFPLFLIQGLLFHLFIWFPLSFISLNILTFNFPLYLLSSISSPWFITEGILLYEYVQLIMSFSWLSSWCSFLSYSFQYILISFFSVHFILCLSP